MQGGKDEWGWRGSRAVVAVLVDHAIINEHDNSRTLIEFKRTVAGKLRWIEIYACCVSYFTGSGR